MLILRFAPGAEKNCNQPFLNNMVRLSLKMLHQNKKTNFGSSFYLSKTEGLGMASIRIANCMELRLVRVWHQAIACISPSPFVLDSIQCSALIWYVDNRIYARFMPCFFFCEATPTCKGTSTIPGAKIKMKYLIFLFSYSFVQFLIK